MHFTTAVSCLHIILYHLTLPAVFTLGFLIESLNIIIRSIWTSVLCRCRGSVGTVVPTRAGAMSGAETTFLKIKYIIFTSSTFVLLSVVSISSSVFNCDYTTDQILTFINNAYDIPWDVNKAYIIIHNKNRVIKNVSNKY